MKFNINEIITNIQNFSEDLKEDYELNDIVMYQEENDNKMNFGYKITENQNIFTAYMKYDKVNQNEYQLPENKIWYLKHEKQGITNISEYKTITQFMDEIIEIIYKEKMIL
jgi:hypothetical protein